MKYKYIQSWLKGFKLSKTFQIDVLARRTAKAIANTKIDRISFVQLEFLNISKGTVVVELFSDGFVEQTVSLIASLADPIRILKL